MIKQYPTALPPSPTNHKPHSHQRRYGSNLCSLTKTTIAYRISQTIPRQTNQHPYTNRINTCSHNLHINNSISTSTHAPSSFLRKLSKGSHLSSTLIKQSKDIYLQSTKALQTGYYSISQYSDRYFGIQKKRPFEQQMQQSLQIEQIFKRLDSPIRLIDKGQQIDEILSTCKQKKAVLSNESCLRDLGKDRQQSQKVVQKIDQILASIRKTLQT